MAALKLSELDFEMVECVICEVPSEGDPALGLWIRSYAGHGPLSWDSWETQRGEKSPAVLPAGKRPGKLGEA